MELSGWNRDSSPYHPGEQELHARLGRLEHQTRMGKQIHRPFMPDQHREFFSHLPFFMVGSVDKNGWPWASVLFGNPGFIESPNEKSLLINAAPVPGDPLLDNLIPGAPLGFVGVELATRRRNRMNGVLNRADDKSILIDVVQSYGNCPQYIQTRDMDFIRDPRESVTPEIEYFTQFDDVAKNMLKAADTFFVASYNDRDEKFDNGGADVNHRGGKPGFIKVEGNTLTIPDYIGNFAFNTLGNFQVNPKAGLLFVDFDSGDLWQVTGTVETIWEKNEEISAFRGAERAWKFHLHHGARLKKAAPIRWTFKEQSPNNQLTGDWDEAKRTLVAETNRDAWKPLKVVSIVDESSVIRSFSFQPIDGDVLLNYKPGQYLTIRVSPTGAEQQVRTYTLSSAPSDAQYRISVKRETTRDAPAGLVSNFLYDTIKVGDLIEAKAPRGDFWLDTAETRPVALFAAGVGVTPMVSMSRQAISDSLRLRHLRPITVFHAARSTSERAFLGEFSDLRKASNGELRYVSLIENPMPDEEAGQDFHAVGRLSASIVQAVLPLADYDCYLCGPPPFMQSVYDLLIELGVKDANIYAESFGPASLTRINLDSSNSENSLFDAVDEAVVAFEKTGVEQAWTTADGTLLELAEAHGLTPNYGCRSGACGSCSVRVLSGKTGYKTAPKIQTQEGEVLICCAVPAKSNERLVLDL